MEEYTREQLEELSEDQKIDLILQLLKRVEELEKEVAELKKPNKDSTNSSTPPSQDRKEGTSSDEDDSSSRGTESSMGPPEGHEGSSRESDPPDQTIDRTPDECSCCGHDLDRMTPVLVGSSQMTVLPPVRAIQLRINILNRMADDMAVEAELIREKIERADVIRSDETGARVNGETWWEWVFQNDQYSYHTIVDSRAGSVIEEAIPRGSPEVWESDLYSSQMSAPADQFQICLGHQQRERQYATDCGEPEFGRRMKETFSEAMKLNEEIDWQNGYTYQQKKKKKRIKWDFWGLLMIETETGEAQKRKERFRRHHDKLFTFLEYEEVSPTNNASERDLRGSVIHRKGTNCFRSEWGARAYAHFKSIRDTARRAGDNIAEKLKDLMEYSIPLVEQKLQTETL